MSSSTGNGGPGGSHLSSYVNAMNNFDQKSGGFGEKLNYINGALNTNGQQQRFSAMNGLNSNDAMNNLGLPLSMVSSSSYTPKIRGGNPNPTNPGDISTASFLATLWNNKDNPHFLDDKNMYNMNQQQQQQKDMRHAIKHGMEGMDDGMTGNPQEFQRRLQELQKMGQGLGMNFQMSPSDMNKSDPDKRARWAEATRRRFENMNDNQKDAQKVKWAEAARRRAWTMDDDARDAQKAKWAEAARRRYSRLTPEQKRELGQRQTERKRQKRQQGKGPMGFPVDIDFLDQQQQQLQGSSSAAVLLQQQQQLQLQQHLHRSMQHGSGM